MIASVCMTSDRAADHEFELAWSIWAVAALAEQRTREADRDWTSWKAYRDRVHAVLSSGGDPETDQYLKAWRDDVYQRLGLENPDSL